MVVLASFLILLVAAVFTPARAHTNFVWPTPYNWVDCNPPECPTPCPPIWTTGNAKARNWPSNPSVTWRRGSYQKVEWHRNNHEGGYFRRSLVPVDHMFDFKWHKKTAFEWGCFTQGRYKCGYNSRCGSDKNGYAYSSNVRVPEVYPDGVYVFAQAWFGGLHWRRKRAFFSDYYSCAYVRIQGGPLIRTYKPTFWAGKHHRASVPKNTCGSTSADLNDCNGNPCHGKPLVYDVAGAFRNGKRPPNVSSSLFKT